MAYNYRKASAILIHINNDKFEVEEMSMIFAFPLPSLRNTLNILAEISFHASLCIAPEYYVPHIERIFFVFHFKLRMRFFF